MGRGSRDYYMNKTKYVKQLKAYKNLARNIVKILATDSKVTLDENVLEQDLDDLLQFEIKLAQV